MKLVTSAVLAAISLLAADNVLTDDERKQGWTLLFGGRTLDGWRHPTGNSVPMDAWEVKDGAIKTRLKPHIEEDLVTEEEYGDFELRFDWRVSPGGNTGLKYRLQRFIFVDESKNPRDGAFEAQIGRELTQKSSDRSTLAPGTKGFVYSVGFEFQLIDDERHPDAKRAPNRTTGSLYSMLEPSARAAKPAGEWNQSRLIVRGDRTEHWVNGVKVLEGSLKDPAIATGAAKRWRPAPEIREALTHPKPRGPFALQHHGDEVWFRNLKVRKLR